MWILPYLKGKVDISSSGFSFERLQLDADELKRVGSVLLFDFRTPSGVRVLIWTQ